MEELILALVSGGRKIEIAYTDMFSVSVYDNEGKLLVRREESILTRALIEAVTMLIHIH